MKRDMSMCKKNTAISNRTYSPREEQSPNAELFLHRDNVKALQSDRPLLNHKFCQPCCTKAIPRLLQQPLMHHHLMSLGTTSSSSYSVI